MSKKRKNFIVLDAIDSTNNYANHLISEGTAQNGTVVLAHYQKAGKGQRSNQWESAPGENLLTSFIAFPQFLNASNQFYLSKIASLALVRLLAHKDVEATIKWPNDIYVEKNKVAGMLIETAVKGEFLYSAVIGIGLNLNQTQFSENLPNPVSLKSITGREFDLEETAGELWSVFREMYNNLEAGALSDFDTAYFNNLFRRNEWALYRKEGNLFEGRITGTGEYGQLLLEDRSGNISSWMFKEIEFVI